ncbi:MAG: hypothetical protein AAF684_10800, partial [Pseudomonadota bacterium]
MIRAAAALLAAGLAYGAAPAAALTCDGYGDYVVCEDGRTYVSPDAVGRYLQLPRHAPPQARAPATAPIDRTVFR